MKIAFVVERFDPVSGGVEVYARLLARALVARRQELHIYTSDPGPDEAGVTIHPVPRSPIKPYRHYSFAHLAAKMVPREEFDVVHGFGRTIEVDFVQLHGGVHRAWMNQEKKSAAYLSERLPIWIKHTTNMRQHLNLKLEAEQFADPSIRVMAISKMTGEQAIELYGVSRDRVQIIYNGADIERFDPDTHAHHRDPVRQELGLTDEVMLIFVGNNFKRKGLRPAIRGLAHLKDTTPAVKLVVVGGDSPSRYAGEAKRLGVEHMIHYVGRTREIEKYYAAADIFVFPSWYDPCALVTLEAMASGLPVITSTVNGSGELITPGKEGYRVDPEDAEGLAQAVRALLDADVRAQASRDARALAEANSTEHHFENVMAYYEELVREKAGGAVPVGT